MSHSNTLPPPEVFVEMSTQIVATSINLMLNRHKAMFLFGMYRFCYVVVVVDMCGSR